MYRGLTEILIILIKISAETVFKSKNDLIVENLALRQQLFIYNAKNIKPTIKDRDRSFWIALKKSWYKWIDTLIIVKPETVIQWERRRFKKHWTKISSKNKKYGRRITKRELRDLIYFIKCQGKIIGEQYKYIYLFHNGWKLNQSNFELSMISIGTNFCEGHLKMFNVFK